MAGLVNYMTRLSVSTHCWVLKLGISMTRKVVPFVSFWLIRKEVSKRKKERKNMNKIYVYKRKTPPTALGRTYKNIYNKKRIDTSKVSRRQM